MRALAFALGTGALALLSQRAPAEAEPAYCVSATSAFFASASAGMAALSRCQRGDLIQLPGADNAIAAMICDFSKSIAVSGGSIVCVYQGAARPKR